MVALSAEFQSPSPFEPVDEIDEGGRDGETRIYAQSRRKALLNGLLIGCGKGALGHVARTQFPCFHTAVTASVFSLLAESARETYPQGVALPDHLNGVLIALYRCIASQAQKGSNIYFINQIGAREYDLRADITMDAEYGRCLTILLADER